MGNGPRGKARGADAWGGGGEGESKDAVTQEAGRLKRSTSDI